MSLSSGPNYAGTGASDGSYGTVEWLNPDNIQASDDNDANATLLTATPTSQYLKATNFGFTIPIRSFIQGIVVEVEHRAQYSNANDDRARIVKGGSVGGTDKVYTADNWDTSDEWFTYGSTTDKWGETWSAADVNASTFGFVLSAKLTSGTNGHVYVDSIRVTVYYDALKQTRTLLGVGG